jgi:hypothetical protein
MRLACLSKCQGDATFAPIGLAQSSSAVCRLESPGGISTNPALEFSRHRAGCHLTITDPTFHRLGPLSKVSPIRLAAPLAVAFTFKERSLCSRWRSTFRGFVPFNVFPAIGSSILAATFRCCPLRLRPQSFSLSRRLAPPIAYWACFIPIPLLEFTLRGLIPTALPYAVSRAVPFMTLLHHPMMISPVFKVSHTAESSS